MTGYRAEQSRGSAGRSYLIRIRDSFGTPSSSSVRTSDQKAISSARPVDRPTESDRPSHPAAGPLATNASIIRAFDVSSQPQISRPARRNERWRLPGGSTAVTAPARPGSISDNRTVLPTGCGRPSLRGVRPQSGRPYTKPLSAISFV